MNRKGKGRDSKTNQTVTVDGPNLRNTRFTGFSNGLELVNASSPAREEMQSPYDKYKNMIVTLLMEEHNFVKSTFERCFDEVERDLKKSKFDKHVHDTTTPFEGDLIDYMLSANETFINSKNSTLSKLRGDQDSGLHRSESIDGLPAMKVNENGTMLAPPTANSLKRRSRSMETPFHGFASTHNFGSCFSSSCFKTPANSNTRSAFNIATVTPLPNFNRDRTATILRKPKHGETAISLRGSPLSVASEDTSKPSITVPLIDGRVLKVTGRNSLHNDELRSGLDDSTIHHLKELNQFIEKLVNKK